MFLTAIRFFLLTLFLLTDTVGTNASSDHETTALITVHGKILDQNQAPVAGAKITAISKGGLKSVSSVTDTNGEFSIGL